MNKYAYIRVSSKDQNIERQIIAMQKIGLTTKQMYIDRQSGKNFERKNYQNRELINVAKIKMIFPTDEYLLKIL